MATSRGPRCITVLNFVKMSQAVAEISRPFDLLKMAAVRHLAFLCRVSGPPMHETHLVVFIRVQNVAEIHAVVSII